MSLILFTSNHPRHIYLANILKNTGFLTGIVIEKREDFIPYPPPELNEELKNLFQLHFRKRSEAEQKIFGNQLLNFKETLIVGENEINSEKVWKFLREKQPKIVITTGISLLKKESFSYLPAETWNVHGGLSPWFKGAITHFWPSFFLMPQFTGTTIHYVSDSIDAGNIIHQTGAVLERGDGLHELACKSLKKGYDSIPFLVKKRLREGKISSVKQTSTGKLWLKSDWSPSHLKLIYEFYQDRIVDHYLDGNLTTKTPKIIENEKIT